MQGFDLWVDGYRYQAGTDYGTDDIYFYPAGTNGSTAESIGGHEKNEQKWYEPNNPLERPYYYALGFDQSLDTYGDDRWGSALCNYMNYCGRLAYLYFHVAGGTYTLTGQTAPAVTQVPTAGWLGLASMGPFLLGVVARRRKARA